MKRTIRCPYCTKDIEVIRAGLKPHRQGQIRCLGSGMTTNTAKAQNDIAEQRRIKNGVREHKGPKRASES